MIEPTNKFDRLYYRGVSTSISPSEFLDLYYHGHAVTRTVDVLATGKEGSETTWHYRSCARCRDSKHPSALYRGHI